MGGRDRRPRPPARSSPTSAPPPTADDERAPSVPDRRHVDALADVAPAAAQPARNREWAERIATIVVVAGCVLYTLAQLHPDLHPEEHHAGRRRHGRPRLGPGLPPRPHPARTSGSRAGPPIGTPASRCTSSTWCRRRWPWWCSTSSCPYGVALKLVSIARHPVAAGVRLGLRQAGRAQVPGAAAVLHRRRLLPVRRDLPDLRRQHRLDDGGRVLVLDRAVAGACCSSASSPTACAPGKHRALAAGALRPGRARATSSSCSSPSSAPSCCSCCGRTRSGSGTPPSVGVVGALLCAFWYIPFWRNSPYMTDMFYERLDGLLDDVLPAVDHAGAGSIVVLAADRARRRRSCGASGPARSSASCASATACGPACGPRATCGTPGCCRSST